MTDAPFAVPSRPAGAGTGTVPRPPPTAVRGRTCAGPATGATAPSGGAARASAQPPRGAPARGPGGALGRAGPPGTCRSPAPRPPAAASRCGRGGRRPPGRAAHRAVVDAARAGAARRPAAGARGVPPARSTRNAGLRRARRDRRERVCRPGTGGRLPPPRRRSRSLARRPARAAAGEPVAGEGAARVADPRWGRGRGASGALRRPPTPIRWPPAPAVLPPAGAQPRWIELPREGPCPPTRFRPSVQVRRAAAAHRGAPSWPAPCCRLPLCPGPCCQVSNRSSNSPGQERRCVVPRTPGQSVLSSPVARSASPAAAATTGVASRGFPRRRRPTPRPGPRRRARGPALRGGSRSCALLPLRPAVRHLDAGAPRGRRRAGAGDTGPRHGIRAACPSLWGPRPAPACRGAGGGAGPAKGTGAGQPHPTARRAIADAARPLVRRPRRRGGDRARRAGLPPPRPHGAAQARAADSCVPSHGRPGRRRGRTLMPAVARSRRSRRRGEPACCAPYLPTRRPGRPRPRGRSRRSPPLPERAPDSWQAHVRRAGGSRLVRRPSPRYAVPRRHRAGRAEPSRRHRRRRRPRRHRPRVPAGAQGGLRRRRGG